MGVRVLRFDGAFAPRGLKFDSGFAAEGCGGRLRRQYYKTFTTGLRAKGKQANHAFGVMEMHPYPRFAGLPPEGEVLAALMLEMLMSTEAQRRANLPLRGRCRRQKGCISNGPQARLYGFRCLRQRCRQRWHIKLIAAGDTTTLGP